MGPGSDLRATRPPFGAVPGFQIRYGFGIAIALLALGVFLTIVLRPFPQFGIVSAFVFLFGIWAAAWWGGYAPGLLVCAVLFFSIPTLRAGHLTSPGAITVPFVSTMVTCVLISAFSANRMRREITLQATNDELEGKVRERTQALEEVNADLQNRLAELETVYSELVFGLGFVGLDGKYLRVNPTLASIHGASVEAHLGRTVREMSSPTIAGSFENIYRQVLATEQPVFEQEVQDGDRCWSVSCAPVRSRGKVIGLQKIVRETTESRRAGKALHQSNERLRQANSDLEQFAYSASHDLQEPLRMVVIYSQLLQKRYSGKLGPEGQEYLGYAIDGASRMSQLVRDLLSYTRASSSEWEGVATIDPNDSIDRAMANLKVAIEQTGAQISRTAMPQVEMYPAHLDQLFQNLIGNAIKYHGKEPPAIKIGAERSAGAWLCSVADNGIGIDSKYKEQIFGVFKRLHTNAEFSGTGIGLAICQRILERRGGRLWVESEQGKGSTFFFTLPDTWER
jgi:PAS domain S-box-containing protein